MWFWGKGGARTFGWLQGQRAAHQGSTLHPGYRVDWDLLFASWGVKRTTQSLPLEPATVWKMGAVLAVQKWSSMGKSRIFHSHWLGFKEQSFRQPVISEQAFSLAHKAQSLTKKLFLSGIWQLDRDRGNCGFTCVHHTSGFFLSLCGSISPSSVCSENCLGLYAKGHQLLCRIS